MTGPATVFAEASASTNPQAYRVVVGSLAGGLVGTMGGIALGSARLAEFGDHQIDTLIVPGAGEKPLKALMRERSVRDHGVALAARARRVVSVCTGAFALAAWGLLDGRRAATHWEAATELARLFPGVSVDVDSLFVEDGHIWTSAGVSTGIDLALALVERDLGREAAMQVARHLVLQMRRPGHQSQFSTVLTAQGGVFGELVLWMEENLAGDLTLEALAARAHQSVRTFHRKFLAETGSTPAAFVERLRLDRARTLLEAGQPPTRVFFLAGYKSLDRFGRAFKRRFGIGPSAYRDLHGPR